jgi:hypothetical protein
MQHVTIVPFGDGETLLVPAEDMWHIHEAAKPQAICERAGVKWDQYILWTKAFGDPLPDWFYCRREDPVDANGKYLGRPTQEMNKFRAEARPRSIYRAASKSKDRRVPVRRRKDQNTEEIQESNVNYWLNECKDIVGIDGWLLRGEELQNVTIATLDQIRRCKCAWGYTTLCRQTKINTGTYVVWLDGKRVTPKSEKTRPLITSLGLLHWLFGADPPEGVFVVGEKLQKLRGEKGRKRIAAKAGTELAQLSQWEHSTKWKCAIELALGGENPAQVDGWAKFTKLCRKRMTKIYRRALPENCRRRAGFATECEYGEEMAEAERCGVRELLGEFLESRDRFAHESVKRGLVARNFFIPTRDMLKFRKNAKAARDMARINEFEREPWFDALFHAWTNPRGWETKNRRHVPLPRAVSAATKQDSRSEAAGKAATGANGRGPKWNKNTNAIYHECYKRMKRGHSLKKIVGDLKREYGGRLGFSLPKEKKHVSEYAKRFAERSTPPKKWPIQRP